MPKASPVHRIEWADFAKGVAIILVVWGHSIISDIDANISFFALWLVMNVRLGYSSYLQL